MLGSGSSVSGSEAYTVSVVRLRCRTFSRTVLHTLRTAAAPGSPDVSTGSCTGAGCLASGVDLLG